MTQLVKQLRWTDKMQKGLDWAVFSIGVLSLTIAIGATILTHVDQIAADQPPAETRVISAG